MKIALTGITATGYHGVLPAERRDGQPFIVDVTLHVPSPNTDQLDATVDYSQVAKLVVTHIAGEPVALIETLCHGIATAVLAGWPAVRRVTVTVHKPLAPVPVEFADICCTVTLRRRTGFVLSLGANLGDKMAALRGCVEALRATPRIAVKAVSDVYKTTPVEVDGDQPDYLNLVVRGTTALSPQALLRRASAIETDFGRQRPSPHAPRTLDIDLIDVGGAHIDTPNLVLPHPRAAERAFVLVPWAQIAPDDRLPQGRVGDLAARFTDVGVTRIGALK